MSRASSSVVIDVDQYDDKCMKVHDELLVTLGMYRGYIHCEDEASSSYIQIQVGWKSWEFWVPGELPDEDDPCVFTIRTGPGDVLVIPGGWFHRVTTLTDVSLLVGALFWSTPSKVYLCRNALVELRGVDDLVSAAEHHGMPPGKQGNEQQQKRRAVAYLGKEYRKEESAAVAAAASTLVLQPVPRSHVHSYVHILQAHNFCFGLCACICKGICFVCYCWFFLLSSSMSLF